MVRNIFDLVGLILMFIDRFLVPLIFAIAFIVFLWGMYTYFIASGDSDEKRENGKKLALWGIIGFVLMIAIWGIVGLLLNSLGFGVQGRPPLPTFGGQQYQQAPQGSLFSPIPTGQGQPVVSPQGQGQGGKPLGALCPSRLDSECASGECDWNGQVDAGGEQVFVCTAQITN